MRQPVQTIYGGAHLFRHDVAAKLGRIALQAFEKYGSLLPVNEIVRERVRAKLEREAVEDLRIDFEDGYGIRSDAEEDQHAEAAAEQLRIGMENDGLPRFCGIRVKSFAQPSRQRAMRTLRLFFEDLPALPVNFCVTLPKVSTEEEVQALCDALDEVGVSPSIELMLETPQGLRDLRQIMAGARKRIRGVHFGPYDFTSACGVSTENLRHPLCIHARNQMLIDLAGSGFWLSDGPTNRLPIGTEDEITAAWKLSWTNITEALHDGFYQGWDLHPAQLAVRYAAVYAYFLENEARFRERWNNYKAQSEHATRVGSAFDDAATVAILRNFFERGVSCGAIDESPLE